MGKYIQTILGDFQASMGMRCGWCYRGKMQGLHMNAVFWKHNMYIPDLAIKYILYDMSNGVENC